MTIYFYHHGPYSCFSNSSPHGFELDNLFWHTCEHYFQAQKFLGSPYFDMVRMCLNPKEAFKLGRSFPLRSDWKIVRIPIMKRGVLRKFETNLEILDILLATGNEEIIENNPKDEYWGCGNAGNGENHLGKILMEVRYELRE